MRCTGSVDGLDGGGVEEEGGGVEEELLSRVSPGLWRGAGVLRVLERIAEFPAC